MPLVQWGSGSRQSKSSGCHQQPRCHCPLLILVLMKLPVPQPSCHTPGRTGGEAEGKQQEEWGNLLYSHFKVSSEAHAGMSPLSSLARTGLCALPRLQEVWTGRDSLCCGEQGSCPLSLEEASSHVTPAPDHVTLSLSSALNPAPLWGRWVQIWTPGRSGTLCSGPQLWLGHILGRSWAWLCPCLHPTQVAQLSSQRPCPPSTCGPGLCSPTGPLGPGHCNSTAGFPAWPQESLPAGLVSWAPARPPPSWSLPVAPWADLSSFPPRLPSSCPLRGPQGSFARVRSGWPAVLLGGPLPWVPGSSRRSLQTWPSEFLSTLSSSCLRPHVWVSSSFPGVPPWGLVCVLLESLHWVLKSSGHLLPLTALTGHS